MRRKVDLRILVVALVSLLAARAIASSDSWTTISHTGYMLTGWHTSTPGTATENTPYTVVLDGYKSLNVANQFVDHVTYRAVTTVAADAGDFFELRCPTTTSKVLRVVGVTVQASSINIGMTVRSSADSGGTSLTLSSGAGLLKCDSTNGTPAATATIFTAAPTAGTSLGDAEPALTFNNSIGVYAPSVLEQPITLRPGQSLVLTSSSGSVSIPTKVVWTEATQ